MTRRWTEACFLLVVVASYFALRPPESLVGSWEAKISGQRLLYTFGPDGKVDFQFTNPPLPKSSGTYTVESNERPLRLKVYLKRGTILECIWEITPEGQLRLEEVDPGGHFPKGFGPNATLAVRK